MHLIFPFYVEEFIMKVMIFFLGLSRHFPTSAYGLYGSNYDPPSNNVQSMQGYFSCNTVANPMHVPLSFQQEIPNNDPFSRTKSDAGSSLLGNPWSTVQSVQSEGRRHKRHHQQSRTIFRCVSGTKYLSMSMFCKLFQETVILILRYRVLNF